MRRFQHVDLSSADVVAGAALCEPSSADFVTGAVLCGLEVSISWQAQYFVDLQVQIL